jgi:hypothetical protein
MANGSFLPAAAFCASSIDLTQLTAGHPLPPQPAFTALPQKAAAINAATHTISFLIKHPPL